MDNKFEENVSSESMIFNDSDTEMPDKSEFYLKVEKLFKEMDTQLELICELEPLDVNDTVNNGSKTNNGAAFCLDSTEHDLVLDEEIGWICTVCHIATLEINNILIPDFGQSISKNLADKVQAEKICELETLPPSSMCYWC